MLISLINDRLFLVSLQGVSKVQPGPLSCVIPCNEAGDRSGLTAGGATDFTAPANDAVCGCVFSQISLISAEFQIHPGNPSVVIPAGQAAGMWRGRAWSRTADGQCPAVHWEF